MARKISIDSDNVVSQFLKRNRERVTLLGIGLAFLLFISGGFFLQKKHSTEQEQPLVPKAVQLKVGKDRAKGGQQGGQQGGDAEEQAAFFLRPLPDELLQQLASMENLNGNLAEAKFIGLRVLWPVYYFDNQEAGGGKATLLLDVSEDGFGVLIESEVELSAYPAIGALQAGQKIWIGGEILAVDPSGTGTIILKSDYLQFSGDEPFQIGQLRTN